MHIRKDPQTIGLDTKLKLILKINKLDMSFKLTPGIFKS